jgi:hypothetical protein
MKPCTRHSLKLIISYPVIPFFINRTGSQKINMPPILPKTIKAFYQEVVNDSLMNVPTWNTSVILC